MRALVLVSLILLNLSLNGQVKSNIPNLDDSLLKEGDVVELPIYYDLGGGAHVRPDGYPYVKAIADYLKKHPKHIIEIGSHTDQRGNSNYNRNLSYYMAKRIKEVLCDTFKADCSRVLFYGYGESLPKISQDSIDKVSGQEMLYQQNRRTEVKLIDTSNNLYIKKYGLYRNRDSAIYISKKEFIQKLLESTKILNSDSISSLSNDEHMQIIRLYNTIVFDSRTPSLNGALAFEDLIDSMDYYTAITNIFDYSPNLGMGVFIWELKIEMNGSPSINSFYMIKENEY